MKKLIFLLAAVCMLGIVGTKAQTTESFKYRRSSLAMILIDANNFENKDIVLNSWNSYPFPDKYNKHDISTKTIKVGSGDTLNTKEIANLVQGKTDIQAEIDQAIKEQQIAKQLVATWFNRSADGKFDMELVGNRGFYNASELDVTIAQQQAKGTGALADAGEELINNTFVTFTQFTFFKNEIVAGIIRDVALIAANNISNPLAKIAAEKAAEILYNKTKEGYSLFSKTWLYKLAWNDSIATVFYDDLWENPEAFDSSDIFKLELVGSQKNTSVILFAGDKTKEQIIDKVEVRNIDNVFAELQKDHDVFKPKVPVLTDSPLTAKIGMKEGLKGGEKFEVLEITQDPNTGRTKYVSVGKTSVDKKLVWDNRYNAGEAPEVEVKDKEGNPITATTFKEVKKAQPGMLLKQVK
ncbi:MAG: hypothetical protein LBD52_06440 [Prevotellaceae bacterium]|jgi:hypothetical protein|nr:hypothetical protein [Prevotellaceae bacterium]